MVSKNRKIFFFSLSVLVVFALFTVSIVLQKSGAKKDDMSVDNAQEIYMSDYDQFWKLLRKEFPLYDYYNAEGMADELYYKYKNTVLNSNMDDVAFENILRDICRSFENNCHLDVLSKDMYLKYINGLLFESEVFPVQTKEILYSHDLNEMYSDNADEKNDTVKDLDDNIIFTYYEETETLVIKIRSFDHIYEDADAYKISNAKEKYKSVKNIVIDVTGNTGGSTSYWVNNIVKPFGGHYEYISEEIIVDNETNKRAYPDYFSDSFAIEPVYMFTKRFEKKVIIDSPITEWSEKKKWVLIDTACISASDEFASFCQKSDWAYLLGYTTRGTGIGETPLLFKLDNTGIIISISGISGYNKDGTLNCLYGTFPDYPSIKGETPLETYKRIQKEDCDEVHSRTGR